jgi:hypothetical protein
LKWKVGSRNVTDPVVQGAPSDFEGDIFRTASSSRTQAEPTSFDIRGGFEGISNIDQGGAIYPPDANAAVGPTHVVEMVNVMWAVYNKHDGMRLYGPAYSNGLFAGMSGPCATLANTGE